MTDPLSPEQRKHLIATNRDHYTDSYNQLNFISEQDATGNQRYRDELLQRLASARFQLECNATKPHTGKLSPGCRLCTLGSWSCLFINGRCNLSCFYCPGAQNETGQPTTNNLTFRSPAAYLAYLQQFNFRGMSLSGGEPLLTLPRTLSYLTVAKKHFGDQLHSWLYTNGSLVTSEILGQLRDAGLDELRFDIGALDYSLDKVKLAIGVIPTVTIEIPAVPEELPRLKGKLHLMAQIGVDYLNLHQLRLTPYNWPRFAGRPYTYLHGEKITVLESELAALELMNYGQDQKLDLAINYCSFVFKNRYQQAAARNRGVGTAGKSYEETTAAGYLRSCSLQGDTKALELIAGKLKEENVDEKSWELASAGNQLFFAPFLWRQMDADGLVLKISYYETPVRGALSYRHPFREIKLTQDQKIFVERVKTEEFSLSAEQAQAFFSELSQPGQEQSAITNNLPWNELRPYEQLCAGLQTYF